MKKLLLVTLLIWSQLPSLAQNPSRGERTTLKKCDAGPTILKISSVTSERIRVQFYGINVFGIDASVFDSQGKLVTSAAIVPKSPDIEVPLNNLKPGKYRLRLSGNTCAGTSESAFEVPAPGAELKAKCDAGPNILDIYAVTATRARVQFYGVNVTAIDASVFDSRGNRVASAVIVPVSPEIVVPLNNLKPGNYKLKLSGSNCDGSSEKSFTIPAAVSARAGNGNNSSVKFIARGYPKHLGVAITGSSNNWVINDEASEGPAPGYEFQYMINGVLLTQSTPLKNYGYQSNAPLRIWKMQTKPGLESLNKWSDREKTYYFDPEAGKPFSEGVTAGFCSVVFQSGRAEGSSEGFINPILQSYDPETQLTAWADYAPDMKLPKGHFWSARRGEWSIETILKKGVTHISNYQLPWDTDMKEVERLRKAGITYNDVPRIEAFMNLPGNGPDRVQNGYNLKYWPNGPLSEKEAIEKANQSDIGHALWIGETMEGTSYMAPSEAMWGYYYKRLRERYEAEYGPRGIPYMIAHNYFMFWPEEFKLGDGKRAGEREEKKRLFRIPVSQFPNTEFKPGGPLSSTNLIMESIYLNAPDDYKGLNGTLFGSLYRMELYKKMGYHAGVFLFGVHEWKPNNAYQYTYPDGLYYSHDKLPLQPNMVIAYAFFSQIYGNLYTEWGGNGKQTSKNWDDGKGAWHPEESRLAQPGFPHVAKPNQPSYHGYNGASDLSYFGIKLYNDTFGRVDGGTKKYLKFRIDGKAWVVPDEMAGDNIINAHYDRHGFVLSQSKNGKTAWFYINPYADNLAHKLEVVMPDGKTVAETVAGNGVHVKLM